MQLLRAAVSLWSGRVEDAIRRGEDALSMMRRIEDPVGTMQALAYVGRALVLDGRVSDGFDMLAAAAAEPTEASSGGVAIFVRSAAALASLSIGDPAEARRWLGGVDDALFDPALIGHADRLVAIGLVSLQEGDVDTARRVFDRAACDAGDAGANPSALAALALARLVAGAPDADIQSLTSQVERSPRSTYSDRVMSTLAAALAGARRDDAASAIAGLDRARLIAERSQDRIAVAVDRLGGSGDQRAFAAGVSFRRGPTRRRADQRARHRGQRLASGLLRRHPVTDGVIAAA